MLHTLAWHSCLPLLFGHSCKPDKLPKLLGPLFGILTWSLGTFRNFTQEPLLGTSTVTWNLLEPILLLGWNLYALLGTSESSGTFTWNPCSEPRNLLEPFMIGTLTWNFGTCRNLYLEPLYLEPRNLRNLTWNPCLEPRNLPEPLLGTLILGTSEPSEPYLEPLLGTSEPAGTFTWNPYSEPRNLPEPLLGTLTWNLGARRNLYLEPLLGTSEPAGTLTWNPYLEPRHLPEPYLELGTCQNLARWLPQSAPGLSLARTPKLSAVGEKKRLRTTKVDCENLEGAFVILFKYFWVCAFAPLNFRNLLLAVQGLCDGENMQCAFWFSRMKNRE